MSNTTSIFLAKTIDGLIEWKFYRVLFSFLSIMKTNLIRLTETSQRQALSSGYWFFRCCCVGFNYEARFFRALKEHKIVSNFMISIDYS